MGSYELKFPLGIDAGELRGLTREVCFVLGYEFALVAAAIRNRLDAYFPCHVHEENAERIKDLIRHCVVVEGAHDIDYRFKPVDMSGWYELKVTFTKVEEEDDGQAAG